jgi:hypothetical protein
MIVSTRTSNYALNPKKPAWVRTNADNLGDFSVVAIVALIFGLFCGLIAGMIADAVFIGGVGSNGDDEATFAQVAPIIFGAPALAIVASAAHFLVLPRLWKPLYFSNNYHRTAYVQFMQLDADSQSLARDAYDALAAFDDPDYAYAPVDSSDKTEYELMNEAYSIWERTYEKLKVRQNSGSLEIHRARIDDAKRTLDTL